MLASVRPVPGRHEKQWHDHRHINVAKAVPDCDLESKSHATQIEELSRFVCRSRWDEISEPAREQLKLRVLDSFGVALGALDGEPVESSVSADKAQVLQRLRSQLARYPAHFLERLTNPFLCLDEIMLAFRGERGGSRVEFSSTPVSTCPSSCRPSAIRARSASSLARAQDRSHDAPPRDGRALR